MEDSSESRAERNRDARVIFHHIYPAALPPMRAEKSALGTMPTAAFQFCEPMRTASSFGWYIFPPKDIVLRWNGGEVLYFDEHFDPIISVPGGQEFLDYWDEYAPSDLKGQAPPLITNLFVAGVVQIWSDLFISTAPGWSILVRPLVNVARPLGYQCFEGLIETDDFKPCPLFVNIRLIATDHDILLRSDMPLFQVQPISREYYAAETLDHREHEGLQPRLDGVAGMSQEHWAGYRLTTRSSDPTQDDHLPGSYGARARRRARREPLAG